MNNDQLSQEQMNNEQASQEQINSVVREKIAESNIIVSQFLILFSCICFAMWIIFQFGFLVSKGLFVDITLIVTPVLFISSAVICLNKKGNGVAFKYIFLILLSIFWLELELMSGYKSKLLLCLLIILSLRYYNKKYTVFTFFSCLAALFASVWCNAYLYVETEFLDLNMVFFEEAQNVDLSGFIYNNIINLNPSSAILFSNGIRLTFLPNAIFLSAITVLAIRFMNYNLQNIVKAREIAVQDANQRAEIADMKTRLMLSQIQPHFIYNTLTTIAYFCQENPQKAEELTNCFSEYLHNNLTTLAETEEIMFSTELDAIKNYVKIEKFRFENRINVEYNIKTEAFMVPVLSVQPIVENAIKHGLCKKKNGGNLWISTNEEEKAFVVSIKDDGVGFDMYKANFDGKEHVGVKNVSDRIKSAGGTIEIQSQINVGTNIVIRFPKEKGLC